VTAPFAGAEPVTSRRFTNVPALSGLRGLALVAVLYHHLPTGNGPRGFGLVGVCTFFALSGFLLTALLIREWDDNGSIRVSEFYRRRVVRLLPAIVAFVPVVVIWSALLGFDDTREGLFTTLLVSNWARINDEPMGVLAHTWTLAIEAQFYVIAPGLFLLAIKGRTARRPYLLPAVLAAAVATWRASLWLFAGNLVGWADGGLLIYVTRATDTRLDAILVGAAVAFVYARTKVTVPGWVATTSFAALIAMGFADPEGDRMIVWGMALATVCAGVLILHLVTADSPVHRVLVWRPLTFLGLISYGLYLWHLPVYKLLYLQAPGLPWWFVATVAIGLSILLAVASYYLVERPFLGHRRATPADASPSTPAERDTVTA
jgi:peptidoglycan/LPS O-acetylase OafA/YrhL